MVSKQPVRAELDFGVLLALAHVTFVDELHQHLASKGFGDMSPRTGQVLRLLGDAPVSLTDLAGLMQMSSPGALKVIEPMLRAGYVERVGGAEDRRVRTVSLTDRGRAALVEARAFHRTFETRLTQELGAQSSKHTRRALTHVVDRGSELVPQALRSGETA